MIRRLVLTLILPATVVVLLLSAAPVLAHPGQEHKMLGTVTMAAPDHVMLKDKEGKDVTVHVTRDTKVLKNKKVAKIEDIRNGMRVSVTAVTEKVNDGERMRATVIELGVVPATK